MGFRPENWDLETDVIVVGTGAAGLSAAILAHDNGAKVTVLERSDKVGGTTSCSGGLLWVPQNHRMSENGFADSREEALVYCKALTKGRSSDELVERFVDIVPEMALYMEENTPLQLECVPYPDYHPDMAGGHTAEAPRSLGPELFDKNELGDSRSNLRLSPFLPIPMTFTELSEWEAMTKPHQIDFGLMSQRMEAGLSGAGEALMGYLYKGCLDRDIEPVLKTRAIELIVEDGEVIGLLAQPENKALTINAGKGVILACGGFEWSEELKSRFLPGDITHPNTPPFNEGDGLKMAISAGANLGNMSECWGFPSIVIPGEEYDGKPMNRLAFTERALPHCIIVNKSGRRFVNEAAAYNDMFKAFWLLDENSCEYANLPAWHIFDQQFFDRYACMTTLPGDSVPEYIERADTVENLAQIVGIDPIGLTSTIKRFNQFAEEGVDHDFQRGESYYDQHWGDRDNKPNPNLGVLEKPPFYALRTYTGAIGTKGGPVTDKNAQVVHISGKTIPGLYAAGNAMAGVSGPSYWGGGGTIAPAMVFGYLAGIHAAKRK